MEKLQDELEVADRNDDLFNYIEKLKGRKPKNLDAVLDELFRRTENGTNFKSISELKNIIKESKEIK